MSAVSVSGIDLTVASGVQIVRVQREVGDEDDDPEVHTLSLYDREELVFVRDALTRLIEAGALVDEEPEAVPEKRRKTKRKTTKKT